MLVINATGSILGRLASHTAKQLLRGEQVVIVNAEKAIITGRRENIYAKYKQRIDRADRGNPKKGPMFPKTPHGLVKRTVRGMLDYKTERGKRALSALKVHLGVPPEYDGKAVSVDAVLAKDLKCRHESVGQLCKELGWKSYVE